MVEIVEYEDKFKDDYVSVHNTAFVDSCYERINWKQRTYDVKDDIEKIFIARENEKIIGEITLSLGEYGDNYCIDSVSVLPNHRNKGIGSKLVEKAEGYSKENGKNIVGEIIDSGDELIKFYQKRGYQLKYVRYRVETDKEKFKFIPMERVIQITEPITSFKTWLLMEKKL